MQDKPKPKCAYCDKSSKSGELIKPCVCESFEDKPNLLHRECLREYREGFKERGFFECIGCSRPWPDVTVPIMSEKMQNKAERNLIYYRLQCCFNFVYLLLSLSMISYGIGIGIVGAHREVQMDLGEHFHMNVMLEAWFLGSHMIACIYFIYEMGKLSSFTINERKSIGKRIAGYFCVWFLLCFRTMFYANVGVENMATIGFLFYNIIKTFNQTWKSLTSSSRYEVLVQKARVY